MIGFAFLGATIFWHTRPRLLLVAAAAMLVAFFFVTITPAQVLGRDMPLRVNLISMVGGQILLGAAMAMIYTASLYFGMVLSDSSTEHSGYHEALIGLGAVIGPGAGAIMQWMYPTDIRPAVATVGSVIALSVFAAACVSLALRSRGSAYNAAESST